MVAPRLKALGDVPLVRTGSPYAVTPGGVRTGSGGAYQRFTPFAVAWREHGWRAPASEPAALERWREFLDDHLGTYDATRDRPDLRATSGLSPHLKLGVLHPRTLLADVAGRSGKGAERFITELAWREFYADVLHHNPGSLWDDLRPELATMTYDDSPDLVEAWRQGLTGVPLVDAGMRQLLATGWMHNRVRMVTASFLIKHLHTRWQVGAQHFLDHLIDADLASNQHGWQWVAGTGTDAAPYFRVFNPVLQGERFDPDAERRDALARHQAARS